MEWYYNYWIPFGIGAAGGVGLALFQTYFEYRQNISHYFQRRKTKKMTREIISHFKSLERKIEQMEPEEARRMLGIEDC